MSLTIESYKLVGRSYLQRLLDQTNEDCKICLKRKLIQAELLKNGYQTFNKDVKCWKISEHADSLSVSPSDQWFFAVVLAFGEIKSYLSLGFAMHLASCCMQFPSILAWKKIKHEFQHSLQKEFYQIW